VFVTGATLAMGLAESPCPQGVQTRLPFALATFMFDWMDAATVACGSAIAATGAAPFFASGLCTSCPQGVQMRSLRAAKGADKLVGEAWRFVCTCEDD